MLAPLSGSKSIPVKNPEDRHVLVLHHFSVAIIGSCLTAADLSAGTKQVKKYTLSLIPAHALPSFN
jgi:hypothetical protein